MTDAVYNPTLHSNSIVGYKAGDNSRVFLPDISNNASKANKFLGYDSSGIISTFNASEIVEGYHEVQVVPEFHATEGILYSQHATDPVGNQTAYNVLADETTNQAGLPTLDVTAKLWISTKLADQYPQTLYGIEGIYDDFALTTPSTGITVSTDLETGYSQYNMNGQWQLSANTFTADTDYFFNIVQKWPLGFRTTVLKVGFAI